MLVFLVVSRYSYRKFSQIYSATSAFNPHRETDKTSSPSYSSSQITYVEAEAVDFSRFHRKRPLPPLPHPCCKPFFYQIRRRKCKNSCSYFAPYERVFARRLAPKYHAVAVWWTMVGRVEPRERTDREY